MLRGMLMLDRPYRSTRDGVGQGKSMRERRTRKEIGNVIIPSA